MIISRRKILSGDLMKDIHSLSVCILQQISCINTFPSVALILGKNLQSIYLVLVALYLLLQKGLPRYLLELFSQVLASFQM